MISKRVCHSWTSGPLRHRAAALAVVSLLISVAQFAAPPVSAQTRLPVDVAIVIAIDLSGSTASQKEGWLQVRGIYAALNDADVMNAIKGGTHGAVAFAIMGWAGNSHLLVDWHRIANADDLAAMMAIYTNAHFRRMLLDGTSIGSAIEDAVILMNQNPYPTTRRIIDVSGDGPNNKGVSPATARNFAVANGITVNGLAILTDHDDLDLYYESHVAGGDGAFVGVAMQLSDFRGAMLKKLVREISGLQVDGPVIALGKHNNHTARRVSCCPEY